MRHPKGKPTIKGRFHSFREQGGSGNRSVVERIQAIAFMWY